MKKILAVAGSLMLAASVLMTGCGGGGGGDKKAADANKEWKPTKDVKVIIAYKAGSGTDTGARLLLNNAKPYVGQTMVIENKPGADGKIGWTELTKAKPDGYTIGFINLPTYTTLAIQPNAPFNDQSIVPICNHLTETGVVQLLAQSAKFQYKAVPYGGTADQLLALRQGEVDFSCAKVADIAKLINGDKAELRVLGLFAEKRDPQLKDVPTLGELGYYNKWYGSARALVAPKGTPENIIKFYETAMKKTMDDPKVKEAHQKAGMATDYKDSKALGALIKEQMDFCKNVVTKLYDK